MLKTTAVLTSLAAVAAIGVAVPAANAGKGSGGKPSGGAGTASIVIAQGYENPRFDGTVAFTISTTATTQPYVNLRCWQAGSEPVYDAYEGYFAHALDDGIFRLRSNGWSAGAARCTATVVKYSSNQGWQPLGSTSFDVSA